VKTPGAADPAELAGLEIFGASAWTDAELHALVALSRLSHWQVLSKVMGRMQHQAMGVCLSDGTTHDRSQYERGRFAALKELAEAVEQRAQGILDKRDARESGGKDKK
jgi:hypothetical protein